jgi:hypothetical protein
VTLSSGEAMKTIYAFRKRAFLNPVSANRTSYVFAHVESSQNGSYRFGDNLIFIADCHRVIELEFLITTPQSRRVSLAKLNLLIDTLTSFRDALLNEIALIEKAK